jgi:hypothetical protein
LRSELLGNFKKWNEQKQLTKNYKKWQT